MPRAIWGNVRCTAAATLRSSSLMICAISREDFRSSSAHAGLIRSVANCCRFGSVFFLTLWLPVPPSLHRGTLCGPLLCCCLKNSAKFYSLVGLLKSAVQGRSIATFPYIQDVQMMISKNICLIGSRRKECPSPTFLMFQEENFLVG